MNKKNAWGKLILASSLALSLVASAITPHPAKAAADTVTLAKLATVTPAQQAAFIQTAAATARTVATQYRLYPSVMIAQAVLESHYGTSQLALPPNNNLFGIKGDYNGASVDMPTQEWDKDKNQMVTVTEKFKKYPDLLSSFNDNGNKLRNGVSWDAGYYAGTWVENTTSYKDATKALTGKYATAPTYGDTLNDLIQRWDLTQYDAAVAPSNQVAYVTAGAGATVYTSYSDNRQPTGGTLKLGTAWRVTNTATRLDGQVFYQVAHNQWISAGDTSTTAPTTVTPANTVIYVANRTGAAVYNTYTAGRQATGRVLPYASAWRATSVAKLATGETLYQVGTNNWLRSQDIAATKPNVPGPVEKTAYQYATNDVLTITQRGGAALYQGLTSQTTGRTLAQGSRWQVSRTAFATDGSIWYQVATGQWVSAAAGTLASGTSTVKERGIVRTHSTTPIMTGTGQLTQRTLAPNTRWQYFAKKKAFGLIWVQVATDQWITGPTLTTE
ncbi:glucosaminidase domain-containing protein [Schleiferilactobacillus shenzhenensis]|nr:glucosaminidase domain-containing protein [Schleiferilactobacillus shenzhenensis]